MNQAYGKLLTKKSMSILPQPPDDNVESFEGRVYAQFSLRNNVYCVPIDQVSCKYIPASLLPSSSLTLPLRRRRIDCTYRTRSFERFLTIRSFLLTTTTSHHQTSMSRECWNAVLAKERGFMICWMNMSNVLSVYLRIHVEP